MKTIGIKSLSADPIYKVEAEKLASIRSKMRELESSIDDLNGRRNQRAEQLADFRQRQTEAADRLIEDPDSPIDRDDGDAFGIAIAEKHDRLRLLGRAEETQARRLGEVAGKAAQALKKKLEPEHSKRVAAVCERLCDLCAAVEAERQLRDDVAAAGHSDTLLEPMVFRGCDLPNDRSRAALYLTDAVLGGFIKLKDVASKIPEDLAEGIKAQQKNQH